MAISGGQRGSRARQPVVVVRGVILVASLAVAVMLLGASPAAAKPVTLVDDGGPDDVQGPKDLNELTVDAPAGSNLEVAWNWDAVSVSGVVTGDACALFDTNNDGNANRSLCVIWDGDARYVTTRLYSCGDTAADRCLQDRRLLAQDNNGDGDLADPGEAVQGGPYASRCSLGTVPDTFGPRPDEGANTDVDTRATCSIAVGDLGSTSAFLTNVCSYQTDVPSSPPVDCVVRPDSGFLNIVKVATPNDPATFAFDLGAGQQANDGRTSFTINGSGSVHLIGFAPGTSYDLTEVVPAGWLLESASCVRSDGTATGTISGDTVTDFQIQTGRLTTCTFTNSGLADLTLVKRVVSDNGGTAMASDWTLTADGAGDNDLTGQGPTVSGTVRAGAFTLSESGPGGYDASGWSCAGGALAGDQLTLAAGDDVTCTITNDDVQPTLTVTKTVVNDDGGTAGVADFPLFVGATPVVSGVPIGLDAGGYTVSETEVAGYAASEWGGDCAPDGSITLTPGDDKTCTITNDDIAATLTVIKTVVNDDGGTLDVADFPLFVDATSVVSGVPIGLGAGSYTVSETEVAGYAASEWGGDCAPDGSVTLAPADDKTCTITNDDIAPTLTLVKDVDNGANPGGTAVADDWTLAATAGSPDDGRNFLNAGGSGTPQAVFANAGYDLAEDGPSGYRVSDDWSCDGGALSNATVTLGLGEHVTCTIANEALGMVELRKLTNGVENQAMMWNFSLTGPGVDERDSSPPTTVDFGGAKLAPGEEYTLCETDIPVGRTLEWRVDTDGDGVPDTIIPAVTGVNDDPVDPATGYSRVYDPHAGDPTVTTGTRCVNFVVDVGETLVFEIDNRQPVGQRRTIGYWKNWNTCTGGNQAQTAAKNGGPAAGWFILDDLLAAPGATIGVLQLDGDDCAVAVDILDRRSIDDGKKRASDGAYKLASHLLAARLNLAMGVTTCPEVVDAINAAQRLLADIGFNGTGSYQKSAQANAEALADLLDAYNNGDVCG